MRQDVGGARATAPVHGPEDALPAVGALWEEGHSAPDGSPAAQEPTREK